jgi:hypothetical protein
MSSGKQRHSSGNGTENVTICWHVLAVGQTPPHVPSGNPHGGTTGTVVVLVVLVVVLVVMNEVVVGPGQLGGAFASRPTRRPG